MACSGITFTSPSDTWKLVRDYCKKWDRTLWDELKVLGQFVRDILIEYYGGERLPSKEHQKRVQRYVIGGEIAAQAFHSFHSERKGNVWRGFDPHVHASVYSIMYDRAYVVRGPNGEEERGAFVKRKLSLSNSEVQKVRLAMSARYKELFEARYGKSQFETVGKKGPKGTDSSWIVNYRYYPRRHDVEHWVSYLFRSEVHECYREVVWNKSAPAQGGQADWLRELLQMRDKGSHRRASFGWISSAVLNKYARRLGIQFEPKAKRDARRREIPCFRCDGVMQLDWNYGVMSLGEIAALSIPILRREARRG